MPLANLRRCSHAKTLEFMQVFLTGGTGYMGQRLIPLLAAKGHKISALVRKGSEQKLPSGCTAVFGNALDRATFISQIKPADTFVQLVGVAHPSPSKGEEFRKIDLVSGRESVAAAKEAGVKHFVYVSVAHPAPLMKDYIAVRSEVESLIRASGMNATILRPWYVLGPGHRWPYPLLPIFWVLERIPATQDSARRLGFVSSRQMLSALVKAVDDPPSGVQVWEVPQIRSRF